MHLGTQHHLHGHGVEYEKHARRQIFHDADAEQKKKTKKKQSSYSIPRLGIPVHLRHCCVVQPTVAQPSVVINHCRFISFTQAGYETNSSKSSRESARYAGVEGPFTQRNKNGSTAKGKKSCGNRHVTRESQGRASMPLRPRVRLRIFRFGH